MTYKIKKINVDIYFIYTLFKHSENTQITFIIHNPFTRSDRTQWAGEYVLPMGGSSSSHILLALSRATREH